MTRADNDSEQGKLNDANENRTGLLFRLDAAHLAEEKARREKKNACTVYNQCMHE
jgi:hypothetical protein